MRHFAVDATRGREVKCATGLTGRATPLGNRTGNGDLAFAQNPQSRSAGGMGRERLRIAAVPNSHPPLPICCPQCHHEGCMLMVKSLTIITVTCASCRHTWAAALEWLPREIQEKVRVAAIDI